ncbi:RNA polymerase sigma factor, partial [bacterium]|nr:RNA polymerase sigma factor [bacterium]
MSELHGTDRSHIYQAVLERMLPEIKRYIQSLVIHPDRAEDLLQDTIIAALCRLDDLKPPFNLKAWLITIARNKSINFLKKQSRYISLDDHPYLLKKLDPVDLVDPDLSICDDALDTVVYSIDKLTPAMQDLLRMKYFSRFSIKEISKILAMPEGTVKRKLFEARNQLKRELNMGNDMKKTIYPRIKIYNEPFCKITRQKVGYGVCMGAPVNGIGDIEVCDMYEYPGPVLSYRVTSTVTRKGSILGREVLEVRNDYEKTEQMDPRLMYYS